VPGQVLQQRRLAHARLAGHHQRLTLTCPDSIDQPVQHAAFAVPAPKGDRAWYRPVWPGQQFAAVVRDVRNQNLHGASRLST
jgi:hypothetical protein